MKKSGIAILVMEKLNIDVDDKPEWSWGIDSGQVGKDNKGSFKAYDIGR